MIAYKFLGPGRVGLFSGYRWPERGLVQAEGTVDPCRNGLHTCRVRDLPYWIDDELWEVELHGPVVEFEKLVLAGAATVLRQIHAWDAENASHFGAACLEQVREAAVALLDRQGSPAEAAELRSAEPVQLGAEATALAVRLDEGASEAVAFVADLAFLLRGGRPGGVEPLAGEGTPTPGALAANLGFVTAHALGQIATLATGEVDAYDLAVAQERERQQRWFEALLNP